MSPAHKRFFVVEQGVGSVVVNLLISVVLAFLMYRGAAFVPLWGEQSIAADTIGTTFSLPWLTCLIVTALSRRQVRAGHLAPWHGARLGLRWLPDRPFWRGVVLGLLTTALIAPPTLAALGTLGVTQQTFGEFVVFKSVFAAVLGVVVTPLIALWAIAGEESAREIGAGA